MSVSIQKLPHTTITAEEARTFLVGHLGLRQNIPQKGANGAQNAARALLKKLRCIQLDPLDRFGTNADLVAWARIDGFRRTDIYKHLMPQHGFEHFAKERCILPASAFAYYRGQAIQTPWWRHSERMKKLSPAILAAVLEEVATRGPISADEITDHGQIAPLDWDGWSGTKKATTLALEVLWTRCEVVVAGRKGRSKLFDVPRRALKKHHAAPATQPFERWALIERVEAAGLLSMASGPHWSMLSAVRTSALPAQLVAEGQLAAVQVQGAPRLYLAPANWRDRVAQEDDGHMRVIAPLDPLVWDRKLTKHLFDFDYIWEVYKPEAQRRWGYYVCPLLHNGQIVGRFEGQRAPSGELQTLLLERRAGFSEDAWQRAFTKLQAAQ